MLKAKVLVWRPLTQLEWIRWVRIILTSIVKHCLSPPNWFRWTKLNVVNWYCNFSFITFSMSFPNVLRRTIRQNIFEESYDALLGFEMIIKVDVLKYDSQWLRLMHILAILTILDRYLLLSITILRHL